MSIQVVKTQWQDSEIKFKFSVSYINMLSHDTKKKLSIQNVYVNTAKT